MTTNIDDRPLWVEAFKQELKTEIFEVMDKRFEAIDKRFESIDNRFDTLETEMKAANTKLETEMREANTRIDAYQKASNQVVNLSFTVVTAAAAVAVLSPAVKAVAEYFTRGT